MTTELPTVKSALSSARSILSAVPDTNPTLDAEVLLAFVMERDRTWLYTWSNRRLTRAETDAFSNLIARRSVGVPVAYLLGEREFWSLSLRVSPDTLIPRADTETVVEFALELIPESRPCKILDLGTGSGAIALALTHERPGARIFATDRSFAALKGAHANAARLHAANVAFFVGDWVQAVSEDVKFDLIISNPPYVADADPHLQRGDVAHEPRSALTAGPDGLAALRQIIDAAPRHLKAGGWLVLEHGADQGAAVRALLQSAGFDLVSTRKDMVKKDRTSAGRLRL